MLLSGISSAAIYQVTDVGLHRPPAFVAVLYAVQGSGSIVGGIVAGAVMRRLSECVFAEVGLALFAVGAAVRAVPETPVVLGGTLAIGVGLPWVIVAAFTAVQQHTAPALVGRAAAAAGTVVFAPTAVAAAAGAGLVALVDYRFQLAAVGGAGLSAAWLLLLRRPRVVTSEEGMAGSRAQKTRGARPDSAPDGASAAPGRADASAVPGPDSGSGSGSGGPDGPRQPGGLGDGAGLDVRTGLLGPPGRRGERECLPQMPAGPVVDHQMDPGDPGAQR
jgi:MFS family permease